ncbi:hypothetical protein M902_2407 [Bacteriovorax sp. BAL6_X]|uniref:hypothetical protein n=1 Tax=Bacteriovorax sp. BAL6_X TaxID=1201290 RepID=UPI0003864B1A|nr:hypothetical protein [Bacteriovorax sp. BAL6_X]EPZ52300.1 hypothetical protein M902_2407 [Bacteriovorax sp. BAL6_X]
MKTIFKTLIFVSAISTFANSSNSTFIVTSDLKLGAIIGFSDSSFNYNQDDTIRSRQFCYVGEVNQVCNQIYQAANDMNGRYYQGSHDRIEILSCVESLTTDEYSNDEVFVEYNLSDDYGSDFSVTRNIGPCVSI